MQPPDDIAAVLAGAQEAPWSLEDEVVKNRTSIWATWNVTCKILALTEEQATALKGHQPMDNNFQTVSDPYQIELSSNAIFVHPHGAWNDWGYTFFLYNGILHYVNVDPSVVLSESLFNRTDDLSHMAKIMIVFARNIAPKHESYLIRLEGDLRQLASGEKPTTPPPAAD